MRLAHSKRPKMTLDMAMWLFTRVSGAAIVVIALVGVIGALLMGARTQMDLPTLMRWTFFPNPNHVVNSDIPDVAIGWTSAFWRVLQILVVVLGATHGFNGLRSILEDHFHGSRTQIVIRGVLLVVWLAVLFIAISVVQAD